VEHVDELIAGEALHALDPADRAELERHLAGCERCRRRLREMEAVASTLAYTAPPAAAPAALRGRLMAALDAESDPEPAAETMTAARPRATRHRRPWPARLRLALTPALAAAAVALLVWNISLHNDLSSINSRISHDRVAALPGVGNVLVSSSGHATLYAALAHAPAGKTYEAWVIAGGTARPAGLFSGGSEQVSLTRPALAGDTVAVTLEPAGGSPKPTSRPLAAATLSRA
jgi:anti-sigma-K factor RskA